MIKNVELSKELRTPIEQKMVMLPINMLLRKRNLKWSLQRKWAIQNGLRINYFDEED